MSVAAWRSRRPGAASSTPSPTKTTAATRRSATSGTATSGRSPGRGHPDVAVQIFRSMTVPDNVKVGRRLRGRAGMLTDLRVQVAYLGGGYGVPEANRGWRRVECAGRSTYGTRRSAMGGRGAVREVDHQADRGGEPLDLRFGPVL